MTQITICLIGDDRERTYPVTYMGLADFPRWECSGKDGRWLVGETEVALIQQEEGREALIAHHPDYGWCSVAGESCRDFQPPLDQARLEAAS